MADLEDPYAEQLVDIIARDNIVRAERIKAATWYRERFSALVRVMGKDWQPCRSCSAQIVFLPTAAGKSMPIDIDLRPHFATCPGADAHRKRTK
jgi:hypothetical protein